MTTTQTKCLEKISNKSQLLQIAWAQLFEGRLALTQGQILTRVSFSLHQKHFLGQFSLFFLPVANHQIVDKKN